METALLSALFCRRKTTVGGGGGDLQRWWPVIEPKVVRDDARGVYFTTKFLISPFTHLI
jgi:hypothetical protein